MGKVKELQIEATEFLQSMRGQYIVSQALVLAVKEMSKVKEPHTEHSNIADMNYLIDTLFPICRLVEGVEVKREVKREQAIKDWCLNENDENTACAKCKVKIGVVPISDDKNTFWICEDCDSKMGWKNE